VVCTTYHILVKGAVHCVAVYRQLGVRILAAVRSRSRLLVEASAAGITILMGMLSVYLDVA